MNRACFSQNTNLHKQNHHVGGIAPLKNTVVQMKKIGLIIAVIGIFAGCNSSTQKEGAKNFNDSTANSAFMYFTDNVFDAGKITQGEKVVHNFTFENRGKNDLIIVSVTASCGCTAAKWSNKPIPAKQSSTIEVVFDSKGKMGLQSKNITVESNATPSSKILMLKCEVVSPK